MGRRGSEPCIRATIFYLSPLYPTETRHRSMARLSSLSLLPLTCPQQQRSGWVPSSAAASRQSQNLWITAGLMCEILVKPTCDVWRRRKRVAREFSRAQVRDITPRVLDRRILTSIIQARTRGKNGSTLFEQLRRLSWAPRRLPSLSKDSPNPSPNRPSIG